jgi:hypothetical protein
MTNFCDQLFFNEASIMPMSVAEAIHLREGRPTRQATLLSMRAPRRSSDRIPWPGTLILVMATAWVLVGRGLPPGHPSTLRLRAADVHKRIELQWDPGMEYVRNADSATLDAFVDGSTNRYPVELKTLRGGALAYVRQGSDVTLTLTLYKNGQAGEHASVSSIGPAKAAH